MRETPTLTIYEVQCDEIKEELGEEMVGELEAGKANSQTAGEYITILDTGAKDSYVASEDDHTIDSERPMMV